MQVKQETNEDEGVFFLEENGQRLGEMRYALVDGNEMEIYHTEVAEDQQGKNLGKELIEAGVNYARKSQFKIVPSCTFAQATFARNKDYQDVLA